MSKELTLKVTEIRKKVLHLIDQNHKLLSKNEALEKELKSMKQSAENELKKTAELNNQIKIIKLARNIGSSKTESADVSELKRKINEYIKEIDHCITMLND